MQSSLIVADDHAALAASLSSTLREWYEVFPPVTSLPLLAHVVAAVPPDVLLLDLSFGREWALDELPSILAAAPRTRIVIFTNHYRGGLDRVAKIAGAHGFLEKVATLEAVRREIDRVMTDTPAGDFTCDASHRRPITPKRSRAETRALIQWLVSAGFTQKQIGKRVGLTKKAIEYHSSRLRCESA